ncbi:hypothetical protein [Bradyrhizobium sp.]|uniref:hypothetical protein n=1 Tax=Bradyrhizobium sp. TaxID=376 RepID=UPI003C719068
MSNAITPHSRDEEIELLLPFYVTGRLDRADAERIDVHISQRPEASNLLSLIREERASAVTANQAFAARPARSFQRVAATIAMMPVRTTGPDERLWDRIKRLFEMPESPMRGWIGAAAALVIVVQGTAIATLVATQYFPTFTAASGGREATGSGTMVVVRFADGATTSAVTDLLARLGMAIVDGPRSGGLFTVRLGPSSMNEVERDQAIADLRAQGDVVAFVTRLP